MNGATQTPQDTAISRSLSSFTFSDTEEEGPQDAHAGDYSARFDELMSDDGNDHATLEGGDEEEEEEGFVYDGVDAKPAGSYKDQLRDILGAEHEEDELESTTDHRSLAQAIEENERFAASMEDEAMRHEILSEHSRPVSPETENGFLSPPTNTGSGSLSPSGNKKPFLHPTVSRLRSTTPQASPSPSVSGGAAVPAPLENVSAAHSHFSQLTKASGSIHDDTTQQNGESEDEREVFRWTELRNVGDLLYRHQPLKASAVLGTPDVGSPTVMAANGLICVGTDAGKILVFDFQQNLICICGEEAQLGAVTALALSFDRTFVAAGHATGYIQLFEVKNPKSPARSVPPTSLPAVASGRKEGHLLGSRIVSIGFIAGRHTAIVSADETGLAFYHSLGKVLFVEAPDILRILGKYPDETLDSVPTPTTALPTPYQHAFRRRRQRKANTILAMAPLPLGTSAHPTETYHLIALLTPVKLVIVGLRPTPKTWYRRHRASEDELSSRSKFKGALAWFPSVTPNEPDQPPSSTKKRNVTQQPSTLPVLVYSWGNKLNLIKVSEIRVREALQNTRTGKVTPVVSGRVVFEEGGNWTVDGDVLMIQWLNVNQVLILTSTALTVYDIRTFKLVDHAPFDAWSLVSPVLSHTTNGSVSYTDAVTEVAHSVKVYKGKIFCLGQHNLLVGTLLTWADRVLSFVSDGDFLSAINLTLSYYTGKAHGNRNGLPDKMEDLRAVIGDKMRELMIASARYAFSEERFTDGTHVTPDGRGVDRTEFFEGLVVTCTRTCIALDDLDFLFEDLYQYYYDNGIARMFLLQLEPFILDGSIHHVPPRVTQRLVSLHDEDRRPDLIERVIWHIDPDCLDINQAITLCQSYRLYDALIYVYTRALRDYVAPVVELLGLIRKVQQHRRARLVGSPRFPGYSNDAVMEADVLNAYKIYPYLANTLTGLTYPSELPIPVDEMLRAQTDVYTFLFFGRSSVWPAGEGGKLVLTSDEENGEEPTYPYTRLLLKFDAESFLHTLDIAFEDPFLNDDSRPVNRLIITKILYEILSSSTLPPSDATFVNIFIARNVPKYPQFIQMTPSALQGILIGLAECHDEDTREDRQLAAEYLLSAYTPHHSEHILELFEGAGFYRILRSWHRQEHSWVPLIHAFLRDPNYPPLEVFSSLEDVIVTVSRLNKGTLPQDVLSTVDSSLSRLLQVNILSTASLLDRKLPGLHEKALEALGTQATRERFVYLRFLLGSPKGLEDSGSTYDEHYTGSPSTHVPAIFRREYLALLCERDPSGVIRELDYLPAELLEGTAALDTCEEHKAYDAVIWLLNHNGDPTASVTKAAAFNKFLSRQLVHALKDTTEDVSQLPSDPMDALISLLQTTSQAAVAVCLERSQDVGGDLALDDLWFTLLESQIGAVHKVAVCCSQEAASGASTVPTSTTVERERTALHTLRSLVQSTFSSLLSVSSTKAVSFPRLFRRLVDAAASGPTSKGAVYNEFRVILSGMLEAYRSDGDLLYITKHLLERDFFVTVEAHSKARKRGWAPSQGTCSACRQPLQDSSHSEGTGKGKSVAREVEGKETKIIVSRTGAIYHDRCLPPDFYTYANGVH